MIVITLSIIIPCIAIQSITTLNVMTLSITILCVMTLRITQNNVTIHDNDLYTFSLYYLTTVITIKQNAQHSFAI